jgi:cytochrome c-type biogenesis protein CcmF
MNLSSSGQLVLIAALATAAWACLASAVSVKAGSAALALSGRRALYGTAALVAGCALLLWAGLFGRDFSLIYVASYTSRSTPPIYTLTSFWAGMDGSLLFWTLLTCGYAATAIAAGHKRRPDLAPAAAAVMAGFLTFFLGLLVFGANPFRAMPVLPNDGNGLNPLLQSPFMAIHPVLLYLGLTGFVVPFSFAVAALVAGRLDIAWFTSTRRWTSVAWMALTAGIALGAAWAYMELGWGGFWAWDPVENASLLPWLTATAFLHSVLVQERRGMLKIWNVGLVLGTYSLAIFGTFLTRSGLLSSVHTFTESPVGRSFLPLLAAMVIAAFALVGWRYERLRSDRHLESVLSREGMFSFNNLLFVTMAFTVLWGTVYPILVEAFSGSKISVGPPFYNSVMFPLALALLGLMGVGPMVAWRRPSLANLRRQLVIPASLGAATLVALNLAGLRSPGATLTLALVAFAGTCTIGEFLKGARGHRHGGRGLLGGLVEVVSLNRRRYGGYIVHLGLLVVFIGLAGTAFRQTWSGEMSPGQSFELGRYSVRYDSHRTFQTKEKIVNMAIMSVTRDGRRVGTLTPQRNLHIASNQPQSEVGLKSTLRDDIYLVLTQMDARGRVILRAWVNPLVAWLWIGAGVMVLGMGVVLSGSRPHKRASAATPAAEVERVPVPA